MADLTGFTALAGLAAIRLTAVSRKGSFQDMNRLLEGTYIQRKDLLIL
ncbi:hypothetical protein [uncultured Dialister sp.]|nr:hypothetical protein [uncultured Dialister sp.]